MKSNIEEPDPTSKKNLWVLVIDKLVIAAIIIGLTFILEGRNATNQTLLVAALQEKADSTRASYDIYLQLLSNRLESARLEIQNENESRLEAFRQEQDLKNQLEVLERDFKLEQDKIVRLFEFDTLLLEKGLQIDNQKELYKERLEFVTSQLQAFYWPIKIRLEKNNAVYDMLSSPFVGKNIDTSVVLPNHLEIIEIIESNIHLAQADNRLKDEIKNYIGHVYMYQALRQGGYQGFPQDYKGNNYSKSFYELITARTDRFQSEYDSLIKKIGGIEIVFMETENRQIEKRIKLKFKELEFDLPLARKIKSSKEYLDNSTTIYFRDYIKGEEFCIFDIGSSKDFTRFRLEEGESYFFRSNLKHYRVYLERVWKNGRKVNASMKVEIWNRSLGEESPK